MFSIGSFKLWRRFELKDATNVLKISLFQHIWTILLSKIQATSWSLKLATWKDYLSQSTSNESLFNDLFALVLDSGISKVLSWAIQESGLQLVCFHNFLHEIVPRLGVEPLISYRSLNRFILGHGSRTFKLFFPNFGKINWYFL